ncbi:hypothetical protein MAR_008563 [Mya arenaria]|uniref:Uncharacterized protein n=1 Tax=Mya arenaria TaxID=6604 RepID=A0ABY7DZA8_MYAAR|nr:hypothetical protein MAR_008563 [Mya arenaria]
MFVEKIPFDKNFFENICMKADNLIRIAILPELVAKVYTTLVVDKNDLNQSSCTPPLKSSENIQSTDKSDEKLYCVCNQVEFVLQLGNGFAMYVGSCHILSAGVLLVINWIIVLTV